MLKADVAVIAAGRDHLEEQRPEIPEAAPKTPLR
jgi:hypothetical protein